MKEGYGKLKEITTEDLGFELEELAECPLEYFAREGARIILTVALNEEVEDFLGRKRYERKSEAPEGYRNGTRGKTLLCGSGEVKLDAPRVSESEVSFRSGILSRWKKKSEALLETIPMLYVEGLSTRDFKRALKPLLGKKGLSRSTVSRVNKELYEQFKKWRERDLSKEDLMYLFLDGYYLGTHKGRKEKDAILVAHGITRDGKRVLLAVDYGGKECADSWKSVIHDLNNRGLKKPSCVTSDGNPGLIRAIDDIWPGVPRQRCTNHRLANVLARIPKKRREEVKKVVNKIFYANSLEEAQAAASRFSDSYRNEFPEACRVLGTNLSDCLTYYRFPARHWNRIRTSNVIERAFREVRRRTDVVGRFPTPMSALVIVWAAIDDDRLKWRGIHMDAEHEKMIDVAVEELKTKPIKVRGFEWLKAE
jgi:transposase-like protein